jgi:hypothetical protein
MIAMGPLVATLRHRRSNCVILQPSPYLPHQIVTTREYSDLLIRYE